MIDLDLAVLKTLITNKRNALEFVGQSDAKIFSTEIWNFANIVVNYVRTYKDLPTLRILIERLGKNNEKLAEYLTTSWQKVESYECDEREYKYNLEQLKKRYSEEQLLQLKGKLEHVESGHIDLRKNLQDVQRSLQNIKTIDENKTVEYKSVKEYLPTFTELLKLKRINPEFNKGIMTGYSFLDFAVNGLRPSDYLLICGESGQGKSLVLSNIACNVYLGQNTIDITENFLPGKNVIYFSLEMPYENCFLRFFSRLSGVAYRRLETPSLLNRDDAAKIKKASLFLKNYPYNFEIIDIPRLAKPIEIEGIIDSILMTREIDAVLIDYLGIMTPNNAKEEQDWLKQTVISHEIREIARTYCLPIVSAVQLNRAKDGTEKVGLHRLARSHGIANSATTIVQIESRASEEQYPDLLYHVIKNRNGPKGKGKMLKNLSCGTLIDAPLEKEETENYGFVDINSGEDISKKLEDLDI